MFYKLAFCKANNISFGTFTIFYLAGKYYLSINGMTEKYRKTFWARVTLRYLICRKHEKLTFAM